MTSESKLDLHETISITCTCGDNLMFIYKDRWLGGTEAYKIYVYHGVIPVGDMIIAAPSSRADDPEDCAVVLLRLIARKADQHRLDCADDWALAVKNLT
jgi:hypothetical protein